LNISILEIGELATMIADEVEKARPISRGAITSVASLAPIDERTDLCILISEHPCQKVARTLDDRCFERGIPFLPMIVEHPFLFIGPVANLDGSVCYHCFSDRYAQHNPISHIASVVDKHYEDRLSHGPKGVHPGDVAFWSQWLLYSFETGFESFARTVARVHLLTRENVTSPVVPVHGCPRCGLHKDERTRSYADLLTHFGDREVLA